MALSLTFPSASPQASPIQLRNEHRLTHAYKQRKPPEGAEPQASLPESPYLSYHPHMCAYVMR